MTNVNFCMPASCRASHHGRMDALAILLGVLMFLVLIALVYGIDAI